MKIVQKVVVNKCYGGYGLSTAAAERIAEIKGVTLRNIGDEHYPYYEYEENGKTVDLYDVPRNDPALVQAVEELGKAANGPSAELVIETVTIEVDFDNYDGRETVNVRGWAA